MQQQVSTFMFIKKRIKLYSLYKDNLTWDNFEFYSIINSNPKAIQIAQARYCLLCKCEDDYKKSVSCEANELARFLSYKPYRLYKEKIFH